jgi:hypothetical protein
MFLINCLNLYLESKISEILSHPLTCKQHVIVSQSTMSSILKSEALEKSIMTELLSTIESLKLTRYSHDIALFVYWIKVLPLQFEIYIYISFRWTSCIKMPGWVIFIYDLLHHLRNVLLPGISFFSRTCSQVTGSLVLPQWRPEDRRH